MCGRVMLGDDMPWLVPLFFGSIAIWMFPQTVETFARNKSESLLRAVRWLPFALLAVILSLRISAIFSHDTSHIEVVAYLSADATFIDRIHVLFAGDGLVEWMLLPLVYLFAWNGQGSKRSWTIEGLYKLKRTLALMLLGPCSSMIQPTLLQKHSQLPSFQHHISMHGVSYFSSSRSMFSFQDCSLHMGPCVV